MHRERKDTRTGRDTIVADVLIIGGGLIGSMLACALGQASVNVILIDRENIETLQTPSLDGRGTAISLSSQRLLAGIGIWKKIAQHAGAILEIRVVDGDSPLFLHYDHTEVGNEPFGWIVANTVVRRALLQRLQTLPTVTMLAPAVVTHLDRKIGCVDAIINNTHSLKASLAIAADGRASPTRSAAGISLTCWNYCQTGIVCTVVHQEPHYNVAYEHFLPAGPFAILPLVHPHQSSIVWVERDRFAPILMAMNENAFLTELQSRFGDFLGAIRVTGPRFSYPLSLQFAESYIAQRLALVGDAAHGMHPLAGQGLNMGIRDVAVLAEVIVNAIRLGLDIGDTNRLTCYQRWRRFDNMMMLALTDVLNNLFSNDISPVRLIRDSGLALVNNLPPLKTFFMRHAMGTVGELPRLLRGELL